MDDHTSNRRGQQWQLRRSPSRARPPRRCPWSRTRTAGTGSTRGTTAGWGWAAVAQARSCRHLLRLRHHHLPRRREAGRSRECSPQRAAGSSRTTASAGSSPRTTEVGTRSQSRSRMARRVAAGSRRWRPGAWAAAAGTGRGSRPGRCRRLRRRGGARRRPGSRAACRTPWPKATGVQCGAERVSL
ncbi:hypothetical protein VPH35_041860 [Triticum aestivum]